MKPLEPPREAETPRFRSAARTHVGKVRALNEDRFVDMPDAGFWAIADGMGGHRAGDVAADMVAKALAGCATAGPPTAEMATEAVQHVNDELFEIGRSGGSQDICGSTVVALIVREQQYQCLWAGDSRAYLYRAGQCRKISRDHSVVQELVDAGLVEPREAKRHPKAHVLTRAVGVVNTLQIDVSEGRLEPGDILLLCSDGLSDLLEPESIEACLASGELDEMADELLAAGLKAGAPDNITLVLVQAPAL
jgi:serine/threonine protein phosphatase Stp1